MITNLFSIFDPATRLFNLKLNWISSIIALIILPTIFWTINNRYILIVKIPLIILDKEFKTLLNRNTNKGTSIIFVSVFIIIIINNILGLFPYLFTRTRHLLITLSLAIPLWLSFIIFGWIKNTEAILTHLVPTGTPTVLIPFIVCIETIRNLIRPGTLAVRLAANIIAGHLILTLLGNTTINLNINIILIIIIIQIILITLETAVAIIQGYVFAVLSTLYAREVN